VSVNLIFTVQEASECVRYVLVARRGALQGKFCQLMHVLNIQCGKYRGRRSPSVSTFLVVDYYRPSAGPVFVIQ
jgi:hypothetical protein